MLPKLEAAGVNVKVIAAISEELFDHQPEAYRDSVLPPEARQDLMFVSSGTRRMWPLRNVGAQADEYSLTSDWDNQWLTGGLEPDVIAEAHLDKDSIVAAVQRFAEVALDTRLDRADVRCWRRWGRAAWRKASTSTTLTALGVAIDGVPDVAGSQNDRRHILAAHEPLTDELLPPTALTRSR